MEWVEKRAEACHEHSMKVIRGALSESFESEDGRWDMIGFKLLMSTINGKRGGSAAKALADGDVPMR